MQKVISCLLICFFSFSLLFVFHPDSAFAVTKIQKPKKAGSVNKRTAKSSKAKKTQSKKKVGSVTKSTTTPDAAKKTQTKEESIKKTEVTDDAAKKIQTKDESGKKIHITADRLIAEGNSNNAEFIGNVRAVQENTVITSNKLKIFYKKDSPAIENNPKGEESIKEIIATGNVKILFDDKIAETEQAVYTAETRILVLNGQNSKITSGKNTISGSKITFFRDDGRINVEGGGKNRVEAFFESDGKSL